MQGDRSHDAHAKGNCGAVARARPSPAGNHDQRRRRDQLERVCDHASICVRNRSRASPPDTLSRSVSTGVLIAVARSLAVFNPTVLIPRLAW
jgi:hypothetical protein